ncbi:MAG: hypothetical protein CMF96_01845, partial [Candidatus Marinimicrobia bacterium]|nr:hypothetical protein [Candidatus Neomarinimicrobiota bacterium]
MLNIKIIKKEKKMIKSFKYLLTICVSLSAMFSQSEQIYFGDIDLDNNSVEVMYNSSVQLSGVQFGVTGVELTGASGGESQAVGWTISTSSTTLIGFSFSGTSIPSGENYVLTEITYSPTEDELCLVNVVFSDNDATTLDVNIGSCISLIGNTDIEGCTDMNACNYDETATIDCNSDNSCCVFAEMFYDCDGNCLNDENNDGICDEEEVGVGCTDENALNYGSENECLFDPFNEWVQSTAQSFYIIDELIVDGESIPGEDSLYVIAAFCGDDSSSVQVGSVQWSGANTTLVVMGTDGVTEGTDNYCFGGLPQFGIPADIPSFVVYDAEGDEALDAEFNICYDSSGNQSDCAWADFGYNNIPDLVAGEVESITGCIDELALNYNPEAVEDDNSCLFDPFNEWVQSTAQSFYIIDE